MVVVDSCDRYYIFGQNWSKSEEFLGYIVDYYSVKASADKKEVDTGNGAYLHIYAGYSLHNCLSAEPGRNVLSRWYATVLRVGGRWVLEILSFSLKKPRLLWPQTCFPQVELQWKASSCPQVRYTGFLSKSQLFQSPGCLAAGRLSEDRVHIAQHDQVFHWNPVQLFTLEMFLRKLQVVMECMEGGELFDRISIKVRHSFKLILTWCCWTTR